MRESANEVTSFVLNHMKIADMRPTEDLKKGDRVRVKGTELVGMIMKFDADKRLAWLSPLDGWWYVKDLEKIYPISREVAENAKETFLSGLKQDIDDLMIGARKTMPYQEEVYA
jgi:hypothetical protein